MIVIPSKEKLKSLSNDKLIDAVKNYRQYGYEAATRDLCLSILNERGYDKDLLEKSGNLINNNYQSAQDIFNSFNKNSKLAILMLAAFIITSTILTRYISVTISNILIILIVCLGIFGVYIFFLVRSFIDQNQFYKIIGKGDISENAWVFLLVGVLFYTFYYFYLRKQMKEQMQNIN
jgi:hypothetical protein